MTESGKSAKREILVTIQVVSLIIALIALAFAISSSFRISDERVGARLQSCRLLKGLVDAATPPAQKPLEKAFIAKTPLKNCVTYSHSVR